jgi:muramoyltetrapeptide carboxypeptidase
MGRQCAVGRVIAPRPLQAGDSIRVVAPSGPFDRALVLRGLGWLSSRYRVCFDSGVRTGGYLAGSDARRLSELNPPSGIGTRGPFSPHGGYG